LRDKWGEVRLQKRIGVVEEEKSEERKTVGPEEEGPARHQNRHGLRDKVTQ